MDFFFHSSRSIMTAPQQYVSNPVLDQSATPTLAGDVTRHPSQEEKHAREDNSTLEDGKSVVIEEKSKGVQQMETLKEHLTKKKLVLIYGFFCILLGLFCYIGGDKLTRRRIYYPSVNQIPRSRLSSADVQTNTVPPSSSPRRYPVRSVNMRYNLPSPPSPLSFKPCLNRPSPSSPMSSVESTRTSAVYSSIVSDTSLSPPPTAL